MGGGDQKEGWDHRVLAASSQDNILNPGGAISS